MFQCQWPCFDQQRGYFINLSSSTNNTVHQYMYNVREFTCLHNLVDPPPPSTIVPVEAILDEHKNSVDEVAKIVQQLRVVLPNKV